MLFKEKERYKRAFCWGKREHLLERWTNRSLFVTIILFLIAFHFKNWYLLFYVFGWLLISLIIHLLARYCHRQENKWHKH